jgi:hypothetical protein
LKETKENFILTSKVVEVSVDLSQVSADLDPGTTDVRWRYTTGADGHGRGVYVDQVLAVDHTGVLFNGDAGDASRFQADGWAPSAT